MAMAKLSLQQVQHVANLAKLQLSKEELKIFAKQLSPIVDYFDQLKQVDTAGVEPTSQTTGLTNITREDIIDPTRILPVEDALSGSGKIKNNYFKVPLILKHKQ